MNESKTINNIRKFYTLLNSDHNNLSPDEKDYLRNFKFTLAESLVAEFSTDSVKVAKMILAFYDE